MTLPGAPTLTPGRVVDGCSHTFKELAEQILPGLMLTLRQSMQRPIPMADLATKSVSDILRQTSLERDFAGCHLLMEGERPVYVGISRKVIGRLRGHVHADTHNTATLAYMMAKTLMAEQLRGHAMQRAEAMKNQDFLEVFGERRGYLRSLSAAFVEIENALVRRVFEAYAAQELGTGEWNTFETH